MQGIVIRSTGSWYDVFTVEGSKIECRITGKMRLSDIETSNPVVVGDHVEFIPGPDPNTGVINTVLPRKNHIIRKSPAKGEFQIVAANIDQLALLVTIKKPNIKLGFIDRALITAEQYEIDSTIIFNKSDIFDESDHAEYKKISRLYEKIGYNCILISALENQNLEAVMTLCEDKFTLVMGQSGVGKSTLINKLIPELSLKVGEVSDRTEKGQHTTSYSEMYKLDNNGWIIDTPGLKEFALIDIGPEHIAHFLPEMRELALNCKFHNCLHLKEPDCAIKKAVENKDIAESRYICYTKLMEEMSK